MEHKHCPKEKGPGWFARVFGKIKRNVVPDTFFGCAKFQIDLLMGLIRKVGSHPSYTADEKKKKINDLKELLMNQNEGVVSLEPHIKKPLYCALKEIDAILAGIEGH